MRSMLLSVIFCLISSASWGMLHSTDNASWTDLVENPNDGLVYKKFQATPFTGIVTATADDPIQRSYKDGVKHGEWVEFDASGLVKSKSKVSHGRLRLKINFEEGEETTREEYDYWSSGGLYQKWIYKNGQFHGVTKTYYLNGQLWFINPYKNGKTHGLVQFYDENGQILSTSNWKDDFRHGLEQQYFENGRLRRRVNWQNGEIHGLEEKFNVDGLLISSSKYKNGVEVSD